MIMMWVLCAKIPSLSFDVPFQEFVKLAKKALDIITGEEIEAVLLLCQDIAANAAARDAAARWKISKANYKNIVATVVVTPVVLRISDIMGR